MMEAKFLHAGEQGLVVEFGADISNETNAKVQWLGKALAQRSDLAIQEIIPTYRSLLVYFDAIEISREQLCHVIKQIMAEERGALGGQAQQSAQVIHIPVCYGGEFGPDLAFVAEHNDISPEEVIRIHTSTPYLVFMLGFTPGFPYLGGMSDKIATPRLDKPRIRIPAGSVGIAGSQTGFYPIESPGGWQLIGRTPIKAFHAESTHPFIFAAGDYLQFKSVSMEEFQEIRAQVDAGGYIPEVTMLQGG